ncbi:MAG: hypothetical protein ACLP59_15700 [Bryobacteraceae bacterium]
MSTELVKKDWKKIARANGLTIPEASLDRIAAPLDSLEADFRPLARALPPETEPAVAFHADVEDAA